MTTEHEIKIARADERFAALIVQGISKSEAWRRTRNSRGVDPQLISMRAQKIANKPEVQETIKRLLREAKIAEIDSIAEYHRDLAADIASARDEKNWTAVAALMRLRGQTIGALQDKTVITDERASPDSALVARLAKKDPDKAKMLQAILGSADTYKTA